MSWWPVLLCLAAALPAAMAEEPEPTPAVPAITPIAEAQSALLLEALQGLRHRLFRAAATAGAPRTASDGTVELPVTVDIAWDEVALGELGELLDDPALRAGSVPVPVRLPGGATAHLMLLPELVETYDRLVARSLGSTVRVVASDGRGQRLATSAAVVDVRPRRLALHGVDLGRPPVVEAWRPEPLTHRTDPGWRRLVDTELVLDIDSVVQAGAIKELRVLRGNDPDWLERAPLARRARLGAAIAAAGLIASGEGGLDVGLARAALSVGRCVEAEDQSRSAALSTPTTAALAVLGDALACQERWAEAKAVWSHPAWGETPPQARLARAESMLGGITAEIAGPTEAVELWGPSMVPAPVTTTTSRTWSGLGPGTYRLRAVAPLGYEGGGDQLLEVKPGPTVQTTVQFASLGSVDGTFTTPDFSSDFQVLVGTPAQPLAANVEVPARAGPLPVEISLPGWTGPSPLVWVQELPLLNAPEQLALPAGVAIESTSRPVTARVGSERFEIPAGQSRALMLPSPDGQLPVRVEIAGYGAYAGGVDLASGQLTRLLVDPGRLPAWQAERRAKTAGRTALISAIATGALTATSVGLALLSADRWDAANAAAIDASGAGPNQSDFYTDSVAASERATTWTNVWLGGAIVSGVGAIATGVTITLPQTLRWRRLSDKASGTRTETLSLDGVVVESP